MGGAQFHGGFQVLDPRGTCAACGHSLGHAPVQAPPVSQLVSYTFPSHLGLTTHLTLILSVSTQHHIRHSQRNLDTVTRSSSCHSPVPWLKS